MAGWRGLVLTVRFATELVMLALLGVAGARSVDGVAWAVLLAVALPLAAAAVWGLALAPRAPRRLPDPARLVVELVLFAATAVGVAAVGLRWTAVVFFVVAAGTALLVRKYATDS